VWENVDDVEGVGFVALSFGLVVELVEVGVGSTGDIGVIPFDSGRCVGARSG
jgi:hypothetical protein